MSVRKVLHWRTTSIGISWFMLLAPRIILVIYVIKHLVTKQDLKRMLRLIRERNHLHVHYATKRLQPTQLCRVIWEFIREKNLILVKFVIADLSSSQRCPNICWHMTRCDHTSVISATWVISHNSNWIVIWTATLDWNLLNVKFVNESSLKSTL